MTSFALSIVAQIDLGAGSLSVELESSARAIAVRGPSGAGKSSLLRVLAGVDRRADGKVSAFGERWQDSRQGIFVPACKRGVGWVPQDALLFPHLSVAQNLGYAGATSDAIRTMAARLELDDLLDRRPRNLSGGEAQRVALGRALLASPRVLLLDEPFAALDGALKDRVTSVVQDISLEHALPLVLATHDDQVSARLCEDRFQIADGRVSAIARANA